LEEESQPQEVVEEAVEALQPQEGEVAQPQAPLGEVEEEEEEEAAPQSLVDVEAQQCLQEGEGEVALVLLPL
jgi:hypothetical protein